jgi:hypothetical protein
MSRLTLFRLTRARRIIFIRNLTTSILQELCYSIKVELQHVRNRL